MPSRAGIHRGTQAGGGLPAQERFDMAEKIKLDRTGESPLIFTGEKIAESTGKWHAGAEQTRWHSLAVYRTESGTLIAAAAYHTNWQGEADWSYASTASGPDALDMLFREALEISLSRSIGYPPADAYAEKQMRMLQSLRDRYEGQISEVLAGDEFAERID